MLSLDNIVTDAAKRACNLLPSVCSAEVNWHQDFYPTNCGFQNAAELATLTEAQYEKTFDDWINHFSGEVVEEVYRLLGLNNTTLKYSHGALFSEAVREITEKELRNYVYTPKDKYVEILKEREAFEKTYPELS